MARPSTHDDIPDYERTRPVATFHLEEFAADPAAIAAYGKFMAAVTDIGCVTTLSGVAATIVHPLTEAEMDDKLARAQATWDKAAARYEALTRALTSGTLDDLSPQWSAFEHWTLRTWAEGEGRDVLPIIDADDAVRANALAQAQEFAKAALAGDIETATEE